MSACAATPRVAPPASRAICAGVQLRRIAVRGIDAEQRGEDEQRRRSRTTLLSTGAQVNGPKTPRALSTSPSRLYSA